MRVVQALWEDYWRELGLPDEFQGFREELQGLPGKYCTPRGMLLIGESSEGVCVGTIALRPLSPTAGEIKRLYVRREWRRQRIAYGLLEFLLGEARLLGYRTIYGDTLPSMTGPLRLYSMFGFRVMDRPYSSDPTPGAVYMQLNL